MIRTKQMHKFRYTLVRSLLVAAAIAAVGRDCIAAEVTPTGSEREDQLIALLQSEAAPAEKAITCKRLAVIGTARCVPALEPLLSDPSLSSWARIPLEAIADPAAGEALRKTLPKVDGRLLVGVINSMGVRRDAGAVEALAERLTHSDTAVACAAAIALGRVGDAAAAAVLQKSLVSTTADVRSAVAQGCILCAERLLNEGKAVEAAALYDVVRQADVPRQRVLEATRGAILARGTEGVPLLAEQLLSADKSFFALGLGTARELTAPAVTDALVAAMGRMTPERQALTMLLLADRGDPSALPAILQAAKSGAKSVRLAALSVLARLGNASCVPALLEIAADSDEEITGTARAALAGLPGKEVDDELAAPPGTGTRQHAATVD